MGVHHLPRTVAAGGEWALPGWKMVLADGQLVEVGEGGHKQAIRNGIAGSIVCERVESRGSWWWFVGEQIERAVKQRCRCGAGKQPQRRWPGS